MKVPWHNQTGLAKATAILATILVIAFGLCGVNALLMNSPKMSYLGDTLTLTAILESIAIILCGVGLIVVGIIALVSHGFRRIQRPPHTPRKFDD